MQDAARDGDVTAVTGFCSTPFAQAQTRFATGFLFQSSPKFHMFKMTPASDMNFPTETKCVFAVAQWMLGFRLTTFPALSKMLLATCACAPIYRFAKGDYKLHTYHIHIKIV